MQDLPRRIRSKSPVGYDYLAIRITKSRIDKGLLAIPVSLAKWFPKQNGIVHVYLDDSSVSEPRTFSAYESSTHESRIGGVKEWFEENRLKNGDEIVIQVIDKENFIYRIASERRFVAKTRELQEGFDNSESERVASETIRTLTRWVNLDKQNVVLNEFKRLIDVAAQDREYASKRLRRAREGVPANLRTLLEDIYNGHCQVCDFWFLKRDTRPYFETHHLNPLQDHHPKNVVAVCGNCHNQFEHANVALDFDRDAWLVRASFNERTYPVNQIVLTTKLEESFKELFVLR